MSNKEVIFGGPQIISKIKLLSLYFNTTILKMPFNETISHRKLNEKKG
jgi:hypothetical protein